MSVVCRFGHFIKLIAKNLFCKVTPAQTGEGVGTHEFYVLQGALSKWFPKPPKARGFMKDPIKGLHKAAKEVASQNM